MTEITRRRIDPSLSEVRHLFKRALDALPPASPDTIPVEDHELECYIVASAVMVARRHGFDGALPELAS